MELTIIPKMTLIGLQKLQVFGTLLTTKINSQMGSKHLLGNMVSL